MKLFLNMNSHDPNGYNIEEWQYMYLRLEVYPSDPILVALDRFDIQSFRCSVFSIFKFP